MKTYLLPAFAAFLLILSCGPSEPLPAPGPPAENNEKPAAEGCFTYARNKDSIFMKLTTNGAEVSGHLIYNLFEKDRNEGTFKGRLHGDTIVASYTFRAEGMESVREVIFLKRGVDWLPGQGEMNEEGIFTNRRQLQFNTNMALEKIDCVN